MRELDALEPGQVTLLGVPWDAPLVFGADGRWHNLGDLAIPTGDKAALVTITEAASVCADGWRHE